MVQDLVVLNVERDEDVGPASGNDRRIQQVHPSDPVINGTEVRPKRYEDDVFRAVLVGLATD
jgi:hypothetical protein